jgi:hypothetical protein
MKALFLVLIAVSAAYAEMPKPEPQLWPNNHEYIIELNGKETAIMIYRRVGDYGQLYEVMLPRKTMLIGGKYTYCYLYSKTSVFLDMSKTKVIKEIYAEDQNPALDFVDPESTPNAIRYFRWKAGVQ